MNAQNILDSINLISDKLLKSVEENVYNVLDQILVIGPDILKEEPLKNLCSIDSINGIIIIANSLIMMYVILFSITQIINVYNGDTVVNLYKFVIKVVVIAILVNFSYYICYEILNIFKVLTDTIDAFCKDVSKIEINFLNLKETIIKLEDYLDNDLLSLNGIIKSMISFGSVSLLINFAIRYVNIIFLILISPFSFITLCSKMTSGIFESWIKLLIVNLLIQIVTKLVILVPMMYKSKNEIMYKIILVGSIYMIYKINMFTKELFEKIVSQTKILGVENN